MHAIFKALVATLTAGAILAPARCVAQERGDRPLLDSLFASLAQAKNSSQLPSAAPCAAREASLGRLCAGLIAARRSELGKSADAAIEAEALLRRTVEEKPKWAVGWYGLGIARLQLERFKVLAKEGPLLGLGVSLVAGAENALVQALELDSTLVGAAEALALAPFPREGASRMGDRLVMLRHIRTRLPLSAGARLNIARAEREAGVADSAVVLLDEALDHGADSGIAYIELARMLYKAKRTIEGHDALIRGASLATSDEAKQRYREELAWIASPEELKQWDSLPIPARSAWLDAFWSTRDVKEGRGDGERLIEHYSRVEYAMANYRVTVPQSGRQRFLTVTAASDRVDLAPGPASPYTTQGIEQLSTEDPDNPGIPLNADYSNTIGNSVPFRQFAITQDLLDDRGTIWIRHGKPDIDLHTTGGYAEEAWMYRRAGEPPIVLFFKEANFQGTTGASTLVPTIAGTDGIAMDQLCGQLNGMCDQLQSGSTVGSSGMGNMGASTTARGNTNFGTGAGGRAGNGRRGVMATGSTLKPEQIVEDRDRGNYNIGRATTTDAFPQSFAAPLDPITQIYGLARATDGAPRLVVAFAIPGEKLTHVTSPATGGRPVYPIRVQVMGANTVSGRRFELDTVRQFITAEPLVLGQYLTGYAELPVQPGTYTTSVTLSQTDGKGAVVWLSAVRAPGETSALEISDLVLGREGSGVHWNSGTSQIPLNPLNAYDKGGTAELYYQLSGMQSGQNYETRLEFYAEGEEKKPPKLRLGFTDVASRDRREVARTVGMEHLEAGAYRLKVTVRGGGSETTAVTRLVVAKK